MESATMEALVWRPIGAAACSLLVVCLVVVWGCNWPINKLALNHIPPIWFTCLRVATGGLTFFLVQALGPM